MSDRLPPTDSHLLDKPPSDDHLNVTSTLAIMRRLRDPKNGCPWDQVQNYRSIVPHTLEEAYEVADAIERGDYAQLKDELGDLFFQVIYYCQFAEEEGRFAFRDVVLNLNEKLIRRHPHVFGESDTVTTAEVKQRWEEIKASERAAKRSKASPPSVMDDVPTALPGLSRAQKLQKRATTLGLDFSSFEDALDAVKSEVAELAATRDEEPAAREHELGDVLFAAVNAARLSGVDAAQALREANQRFEDRIRVIENGLREDDQAWCDLDQAEQEKRWADAKRKSAK